MAAENLAAEHGPSAGEYIVHHLTFWQNKKPGNVVDFTVFNWDSLLWAILIGVVGCFFLWKAARKATAGLRQNRPTMKAPRAGTRRLREPLLAAAASVLSQRH